MCEPILLIIKIDQLRKTCWIRCWLYHMRNSVTLLICMWVKSIFLGSLHFRVHPHFYHDCVPVQSGGHNTKICSDLFFYLHGIQQNIANRFSAISPMSDNDKVCHFLEAYKHLLRKGVKNTCGQGGDNATKP